MAINPQLQLPPGLNTANVQFFDALIRHQIGLLRVTGSIRNEIWKILDDTEADMRRQITERLRRGADVRRLNLLLDSLSATRAKAWDQIDDVWVRRLVEVANAEPAFVGDMVRTVSPSVINTVLPDPRLLRSLVAAQPFEGKTLREWAANVRAADIDRIQGQIRIGVTQGEAIPTIARRVVGTVRARGTDGIVQVTRRDAEGITRTAVNAISNHARREFFKENSDIFTHEVYVATLDSLTTPICRALDGQRFPVGQGPIPPRHFNCRSLRVGVLNDTVIANRPTKPFTERQLLREFTQSQNINTVASRANLPRGTKGKYDRFSVKRKRELTGKTPAKVSYQQWLQRQPETFQNEILGVTRGKLFRDGGLTLPRFVNRAGDEIPLSQLARLQADAFRAAGLNPADFR